MSGNPFLRALAVAASAALLVTALAVPATAADKSVCKDGGWKNIETSGGDSFKNQGQCIKYVVHGGTFGPPRILAIAYSDLDGSHTFNAGDVLISKLVDTNGDGVPSAGTPGDTIEMGRYPTTSTPTSTDFGDWGITHHEVVKILNQTATLLYVETDLGVFTYIDAWVHGYEEEPIIGPPTSIGDVLDGTVSGGLWVEPGSPSRPGTEVSEQDPDRFHDDRFIDVELRY